MKALYKFTGDDARIAPCKTVGKPLMGFSDKLSQSAARTPWWAHTCSLRCIFCQVHAPTENELTLFADFRRQTLRGFLTRCLGDDARIAPCFLYAVLILGRRFP